MRSFGERSYGRRILALATALVLVTGLALSSARAEYPDKPVRIFLPYGPGGVADVMTRLVAQKLSERLGKQFIVDNRPGAGGIVAAVAAVSSPPDGYTLFLMGNGAPVSVSLFKSLPYDLINDFASISLMAKFDVVLATSGDAPFESVSDIVAYARAHPGKLNFGAISAGSTQNLAAELFKMLAQVDVSVVAYRSSPDLVTALLRGDVQVGFDYIAAFSPALKSKKIKIIATAGDGPSPYLPGVPTVAASGYPEFTATGWNGLSVPKKVPPEIVAKLSREVNEVLKDPEVQERAAQFGMEAVGSTPDELSEIVRTETLRWGKVIDKLGIQKQ